MRGVLVLGVVLAAGILAATARADGLPVVDVDVGPSGVVDSTRNVRYIALSLGRRTLVGRIERNGGRVVAYRQLRGSFTLPAVAYDGSAAGLSGDGRSLVLITPRPGFPRPTTKFAVLDARKLKLQKTLTLPGDYSFDALSRNARWMYLIRYTSTADPLQYEVVALDLRSGRLAARPIVDPREPDEQMNGHPLTRATSSDSRWAYTLYEGTEHPFVHALDTARRDARCIDLDWLTGRKGLWALRFAVSDDGRDLIVQTPKGDAVAVVDTETFEAARPSSAGFVSWPKTALSSLALVLVLSGLVYVVRARMRYEPTS
jgi:hypothetical protein